MERLHTSTCVPLSQVLTDLPPLFYILVELPYSASEMWLALYILFIFGKFIKYLKYLHFKILNQNELVHDFDHIIRKKEKTGQKFLKMTLST